MAVKDYDFTLVLANLTELTDDLADALFVGGCDDCTPSSSNGVVRVSFTRSGERMEDVVTSTIIEVMRAGFTVAYAELGPELVREFREEYENWATGLGQVGRDAHLRGARGCGTSAIGDLMRGIKLCWASMDESFRARVQQHYSVTKIDGEVLVNLR
ncbi:MAG: hypothetical protein K2W95_35215 [Candidatus Obscuribacterales bacterium]|nr:hypothetical protein [Candidatus Obscuribacterales bacterium]